MRVSGFVRPWRASHSKPERSSPRGSAGKRGEGQRSQPFHAAGSTHLAEDQTPTPSGATGANRQPRILAEDKISSRRSPKEFVDASRLRPPRKCGRLLKSQTQAAHAGWIEKGRPKPITGKICDAISKTVYLAEFEKIRLT